MAEIEETPSDYKVLTFHQVGGKDFIRLVSAEECEVSHESGIYLCGYSRKDNQLRVVIEMFGTKQVVYFEISPEGLRSSDGKLAYVAEGARSKAEDDEAGKAECVKAIRNIQQIVRSSQYMNNKSPGDPIVWSELVGPGKFMEKLPECPVHGSFKLSEVYPQVGSLAAECVKSGPEHKHLPESFSDW